MWWTIDREFEIAMEKPGVDPTAAPRDWEGIGTLVTVYWEDELEDEWVVETFRKGEKQARAIAREYQGDPIDVVLAEVYVSEDGLELTGYGTRRFRANPGFLGRLLGL